MTIWDGIDHSTFIFEDSLAKETNLTVRAKESQVIQKETEIK